MRPQAAALAAAFSVTFWPAETARRAANRRDGAIGGDHRVGGVRHAGATGIGGAQALLDLEVLVLVGHMAGQDSAERSATVVGKGARLRAAAPAAGRSTRLLFRESISAAIPETMGAEKLVPRLLLVWSVKVLAPGPGGAAVRGGIQREQAGTAIDVDAVAAGRRDASPRVRGC